MIINSLDEIYQTGYNIGNNEGLAVILFTLASAIILSAIKQTKGA